MPAHKLVHATVVGAPDDGYLHVLVPNFSGTREYQIAPENWKGAAPPPGTAVLIAFDDDNTPWLVSPEAGGGRAIETHYYTTLGARADLAMPGSLYCDEGVRVHYMPDGEIRLEGYLNASSAVWSGLMGLYVLKIPGQDEYPVSPDASGNVGPFPYQDYVCSVIHGFSGNTARSGLVRVRHDNEETPDACVQWLGLSYGMPSDGSAMQVDLSTLRWQPPYAVVEDIPHTG